MDWVTVGPDDGQVHADEATVAAAAAAAAGAGCVVTVGSGTITDIGKAAAPAGVPLVTVQTATSVNGYADPFSVLLRQGVKRTTPSRWPDALIIDPAVLHDAPPDLNRAGMGDMMAMFTATADWYLASAVAGTPRTRVAPAARPAFRPPPRPVIRPTPARAPTPATRFAPSPPPPATRRTTPPWRSWSGHAARACSSWPPSVPTLLIRNSRGPVGLVRA